MGSRLLGHTRQVIGTIFVVLHLNRFLFTRGRQEGAVYEPFAGRRLGWSCVNGVNKFLIHNWLLICLGLALDLVDLDRFFSFHLEWTSGYWFSAENNIYVMAPLILGSEDTIESTVTIVENFTWNLLSLGAFDGTLGYTYIT